LSPLPQPSFLPLSPTTPHKISVALVEDDHLLREELAYFLRARGFVVHPVGSGHGLDELLTTEAIDTYIIDLNLPGEGGLSICNRLRRAMPEAGIIIMTARVAVRDRLAGYQQGGADFYLPKPVVPDELVMVLMSLSRRMRPVGSAMAWRINLRDRTLAGPEEHQRLWLTHREQLLLVALAQAKGNQLGSDLLAEIFEEGGDPPLSAHALEEVVVDLRRKVRAVQGPADEPIIKSVWGRGYTLCIPLVLA
jgi:DNA-binding response OmpR family regulator